MIDIYLGDKCASCTHWQRLDRKANSINLSMGHCSRFFEGGDESLQTSCGCTRINTHEHFGCIKYQRRDLLHRRIKLTEWARSDTL